MTNNGNVAPNKYTPEDTSEDYEIVSIICSGCHTSYYFYSEGSDFDYRVMGCCNEREYIILTCKTTEGEYFQKELKNSRFWK